MPKNTHKHTPALMIQGTGSHVGKSLLVAGLCRYFARMGVKTAPFKPQNMSNNAAVAEDGGEIGRAQALQALAAGIPPSHHMNPVLLKPEGEKRTQVIIHGKMHQSMTARTYTKAKAGLLPAVLTSFRRLQETADLVIIEGAGSPAEINLREGDIANMGFAEAADVAVVLVGDIDRGGVIATLIGTHAVLGEADRGRIKGFLINKFRGDKALLGEAEAVIAEATQWQNLGVVPWFAGAEALPFEDSLGLATAMETKSPAKHNRYHIAVPILPRLANMDDLDPLRLDPRFRMTWVKPGTPLPLDADMVLLAGSKTTIADLAFFRKQQWEADLHCLVRHGCVVVGLCGGYQMLGQAIHDPHGIESGGKPTSAKGLGLLDVETVLAGTKTTEAQRGTMSIAGLGEIAVAGYAIHLGTTTGADTVRPMLMRNSNGEDGGRGGSEGGRVAEGAVRGDGQVMGCYMHGLFASDALREGWMKRYGGGRRQDDGDGGDRRQNTGDGGGRRAGGGGSDGEGKPFIFAEAIDQTLDDLADHLSRHCDMAGLRRIAGLE